MRAQSIRVFVNENKIVEISPYLSLFSFREKIRDELYTHLDQNITLQLYYHGKRLTTDNDGRSICKLGIEDNSAVIAAPILEGGVNATYDFLWTFYYLSLVLFIIFLLSGFLPIFANAFAHIFNDTIFALLDKFTTNKKSSFIKFTRLIIRFIAWVIRYLATIFFVWVITAYMMFPWLYSKKNKFCESALAAKRIGWWTMFIFVLVYITLNIPDGIINASDSLAEHFPKLFEASIRPTLQGIKETWDLFKFAPIYLLPGVLQYHEIIEELILGLFDSMSIIGTFDCSDPTQADEMCKLFGALKDLSQKKSDAAQLSKNLQSAKLTQFLDKQQERINKKTKAKNNYSSGQNIDIFEKEALVPAKEFINNYKLGPALELLNRGFCDIAAKDKGEPPLVNPDPKNKYILGSFNRWSAGFFTSFFCQLVEAVNDMNNTLYGIGTENQVVNMIKSGNVAGIGAGIYLIIMLIYTTFSSSFAGFSFG